MPVERNLAAVPAAVEIEREGRQARLLRQRETQRTARHLEAALGCRDGPADRRVERDGAAGITVTGEPGRRCQRQVARRQLQRQGLAASCRVASDLSRAEGQGQIGQRYIGAALRQAQRPRQLEVVGAQRARQPRDPYVDAGALRRELDIAAEGEAQRVDRLAPGIGGKGETARPRPVEGHPGGCQTTR